MHRINSTRPVDARWRRITDLADCGMHARHTLDDDEIRRGLTFLNRLRACRDETDRVRLRQEMPDIDAAHRLHTSDDKMERALVEARLLARQTINEVAAACRLTRGAIIAYERIFFQIFGRLDASLFIMPNAVGIELSGDGLREDDHDILLKLYAYQRGPLFLELVLRYIRNGIRVPDRFDRASRADLLELVMMLEIRAVILTRVLPFEKLRRAHRVMGLARELKTCIDSMLGKVILVQQFPKFLGDVTWSPEVGEAAMEPHAEPTSSPCQVVAPEWWSALRETALAA